MANKSQTQLRIERNKFKSSKMIDDPSYFRILDYKKEHLFEGIVFELLLRDDGFNALYQRLFNHLKLFKEKATANQDVILKGLENTKFEGKDADLEEAIHIMMCNSNQTNLTIQLLLKKYGYDYNSLIMFIGYIIDRYYTKADKLEYPQLKDIGFIKENILDKSLNDEHIIYDLLEKANISEEFYNFLINFDIVKYRYVTGIPENLKFKKKTVNFEVKLFQNKLEQDRELNKIKKYLDVIKNESTNSGTEDLTSKIEKYINNPKETNLHILNHFYCYDMMSKGLNANTIKKLTSQYLEEKKKSLNNNSLDEFINTYTPIKTDAIIKYKKKINELVSIMSKKK